MKISIIIPSFNQARYLEETLRSVMEQDGDNEIIVIDGGSTDGSVEILRRYENHLAFWTSQKDRGQTDAINQGLLQATGEAWAYLNSDDLLVPGALTAVREAFQESETEWVGGDAEVFGPQGPMGQIRPKKAFLRFDYLRPWRRSDQYVFPFSGSSFMRRSVIERLGVFDDGLHFCMDVEYYLRAVFQGGLEYKYVPRILAKWRRQPESKTEREGIAFGFREEEVLLARRYLKYVTSDERLQLEEELVFEQRQVITRKASYLGKKGHGAEGCLLLLSSTLQDPALLTFRPWWGALRRCIGRG